MTYPFGNILKALLPTAVVLVVALGLAGPAAAKTAGGPACWKTLINDWYDGRIDGTYAIHCYRDALKHLPADVETYSSARDDIKQALEQRITQSHTTTTTTITTPATTTGTTKTKKSGSGGTGGSKAGGGSAGGGTGGSTGGGSTGGGTAGGGTGGGSTGGGSAGGGTTGGSKSGGTTGGGTTGGSKSGGSAGDKNAAGPIGQVFSVGKPSKADSVPVPLIVLGAVALLLMAAGAASFLTRRLRTRRLQLASAATLPQQGPGHPSERP